MALSVAVDGKAWVASARGVAVEPGEIVVRVSAWNADGRSLESGEGEKFLVRRPSPPPEVDLLSPARDATVSLAGVVVKFRVHSASPLTRVELVRASLGSGRETLARADLAQVTTDSKGRFELVFDSPVNLIRNENLLKAVAVNEGGEGTASVNLSYVPPPVQVVIDRFEPSRTSDQAVETVVEGTGRLGLQTPLPDGHVRVRGRVICLDDASRADAAKAEVQFWVNGFPQAISAIRSVRSRSLEADFAAEVLLGRPDNLVEVRLSGPARELSNRSIVSVNCREPVRDQRLHLFILGVGPIGPDEIKDRALRALRGKPIAGVDDEFQTPAFSRGWIYGPLCGTIPKTRFLGQVMRIKKALVLGTRPSNDVVVVYYQGSDSVEGSSSSPKLRLSPHRADLQSVALDEIVELLSDTRGAKLFLLDVARDSNPMSDPLASAPSWPEGDSRYGMLRFLWKIPGGTGQPRPTTPAEVGLITAIQDAWPVTVTLRDVASQLAVKAGSLEKRYPNLSYDQVLSDALADVIVGVPKP